MPTTPIGPTPLPLPGIAQTPPLDESPADASTLPHDAQSEATGGADPFSRLGLNDLHRLVQQFAPGPRLPHAGPQGTGGPGAGVPLYDTQGPGAQGGPQLPAPIKPGAPMDIQRLEVLNEKAKRFNVDGFTTDPELRQDLKAARAHLNEALKALKAGDYKQAENQLKYL